MNKVLASSLSLPLSGIICLQLLSLIVYQETLIKIYHPPLLACPFKTFQLFVLVKKILLLIVSPLLSLTGRHGASHTKNWLTFN